MKYDQDGFLYGGRSIITRQDDQLSGVFIGSIGASLSGIKYDTSEILKHLRSSKGLFSGGVVDARIVGQRQQVATVEDAAVRQQRGKSAARIDSPNAFASSEPAGLAKARDSKGRFISTKVAAAAIEAIAAGKVAEPVLAANAQKRGNGGVTPSDPSTPPSPPPSPPPPSPALWRSSGGVGVASDSVAQVDPVIAAAKEIKGFASGVLAIAEPVIGFAKNSFFGKDDEKDAEPKKSNSLLKRILSELRLTRKESAKTTAGGKSSQKIPAGAGGDSALGGIGTFLAGALGLGAGGMVRSMLSKGAAGAAKVASKAKGAPLVGTVLSAIGAGASAIAIDADKNLNDDQRLVAHSKNVGDFAGTVGGMLAGGMVGSAVLPGIGTAIGAVFGAWLGGRGGGIIGEAIGEAMGDSPASGMLATLFKRIRDGLSSSGNAESFGLSAPQAAGAPALGGALGSVAALGESGGKLGVVSSGKGDKGGISYGKFQMSSNAGTVDKFIKESKYGKQFAGLQVGTKEFANRWRELELSAPGFIDDQRGFIMKEIVSPAASSLKQKGIDLSSRGGAVQEMLFSTANQFGRYGGPDLIASALAGKKLGTLDDISLIRAVQQHKILNNESLFRSSSQDARTGTLNRARNELILLSGMAGMEAGRGKSAIGGLSAVALPNVPAMAVPKIQAVTVPEMPRIDTTTIPAGQSMQPQRHTVVAIPAASAPVQQEVSDKSIAHTAAGGIGRGAK